MHNYYKTLREGGDSRFPWKAIWRVIVPPRVAVFTRTAAKGRLLTIDNLRKQEIVNSDWCCTCKYEESVDHLFLHCQVYQDLWSLILFFFGLCWVMPRSVVDY